jgi:prepilin-type N-terminal cleavage/methylation domain-containing protein
MMSNREGFSLVEVLAAVIIMAIIMTSLSGLTFMTARQAVRADNTMVREAAALETVNRFATLPYASLAAAAGCDSAGGPGNWYQRCATVTSLGNARRVDIVTTPMQRGIPATTVTLIRNPPATGNPLCSPSC